MRKEKEKLLEELCWTNNDPFPYKLRTRVIVGDAVLDIIGENRDDEIDESLLNEIDDAKQRVRDALEQHSQIYYLEIRWGLNY